MPHRPPLLRCLLGLWAAQAFTACHVPLTWAPRPPVGSGYQYRFSGVYQKSTTAGSQTTHIGSWRFTNHYAGQSGGVTEVDVGPRIFTEPPVVGSEADGRFNMHLGEAGQPLREQP